MKKIFQSQSDVQQISYISFFLFLLKRFTSNNIDETFEKYIKYEFE